MLPCKTLVLVLTSITVVPAVATTGSTATAQTLRSTYFPGESDARVMFPPNASGTITGSMTFEAWVWRVERRSERLWTYFTDGGELLSYSLGGDGGDTGPVLVEEIQGERSGPQTRPIPARQWCHVAVTWNPASSLVRFYVDGKLDTTSSLAGSLPNVAAGFVLGGAIGDEASASFRGYLDEVRFWNIVRSESQIRNERFRELRSEAGLVAVFPGGGVGDVVAGLPGEAHGGIRRARHGVLPRELTIPSAGATPPDVDGVVGALEYLDAEVLPFGIHGVGLAGGDDGRVRILVYAESTPGAGDFDELVGALTPFPSDLSAIEFYGLDTNSGVGNFSGPVPGITPAGTHLFFVDGRDGLSMLIVHDSAGPASPDPRLAHMRIVVSGDEDGVIRTVEDGPDDTYSPADGGPASEFVSQHLWTEGNTDGQALTGLDGDWQVDVEFTALAGQIERWDLLSSDGITVQPPFEPFRRLRFVPQAATEGDAGLAAWLVHTPEDLILGFPTLPGPVPAGERSGLFVLVDPDSGGGLRPATDDLAFALDLVTGNAILFRGTSDGGFAPCGDEECPPIPSALSFVTAAECHGPGSGPCAELRISRELFPDGRHLHLAVGYLGGAAQIGEPVNLPAASSFVAVGPLDAVVDQPASWAAARMIQPGASGAGSCEEPLEVVSDPLPATFRGRPHPDRHQIDVSPCLPRGTPGAELNLEFTAPSRGVYRIAVIPLDDVANVSLLVAEACPASGGECLAGADENGAGAPEYVDMILDSGQRIHLVVDGALESVDAPQADVDVRIDRLEDISGGDPASPTKVGFVRAVTAADFESLVGEMPTVWRASAESHTVVGEASRELLVEFAGRGQGVREMVPGRTGLVSATPLPEPPNHPRIVFDRLRYDLAEKPSLLLELDTDPDGLDEELVVVVWSSATGDIESVSVLRHDDHFAIEEPLPLVPQPVSQNDGRLAVTGGDVLFAAWKDPRPVAEDASSNTVAWAYTQGLEGSGRIELAVDPALAPPIATVPGRGAGEPPRSLAAIGDLAGATTTLALDQVVFRPRSERELARFLDRYGADVVEGEAEFDPNANDSEYGGFVVARFDAGRVDTGDATLLLELVGGQGRLSVSRPEVLPLLVLWATERLRGAQVSPNLVLDYHGQPTSNDPDDPFRRDYVTDCKQGLQRAWMFTALADVDRAPRAGVRVAVIDAGFCPRLADEVSVLGGFDFFNENPSPYGDAEPFPPNTHRYHGSVVSTLVGGRLNNGVGAAGVGGTTADLLLYNIGGLPFLSDGARAIRGAVIDGARVINMSWGAACSIGGIDFCDPSWSWFCSVFEPRFGFRPPVEVGCGDLVASLREGRIALESAVRFAVDRDVVCVASAGNASSDRAGGDIDSRRVIPAVLPGVLAVGVTDATYANTQGFGPSVDLWTLESLRAFAPAEGGAGSCPAFVTQDAAGASSGAAFVSGVVAMMRAARPALDRRTLESVLSASTERSPAPAADPLVPEFLLADAAVIQVASEPGDFRVIEPIQARSLLNRTIATGVRIGRVVMNFDEVDGNTPAHYGDGPGQCGWPVWVEPQLAPQPANDAPHQATETVFDFLSERAHLRLDHGLHDFTVTGDREEDWYVIPASATDCETFDLTVSTSGMRGLGEIMPLVPAPGDLIRLVRGTRINHSWLSSDVFLEEPLTFQVVGDDGIYDLSVTRDSSGVAPPDRFESNDEPADAVELPGDGATFRRTESVAFVEYDLTLRGLSIHCPDDRDGFIVDLPDEVEQCEALGSQCGVDDSLPQSSELTLSAVGAQELIVYDVAGAVVDRGVEVDIFCPRTNGLDRVRVEVVGDGSRRFEYTLVARYRAPRASLLRYRQIHEALASKICCTARGVGLDPCGVFAPLPELWGGPLATTVDFWFPESIGPQSRVFAATCPLESCDPVPAAYHALSLLGEQEIDIDLQVTTPISSVDSFRLELFDPDLVVVAEAAPYLGPSGKRRKGVDESDDPERLTWRLLAGGLEPGLYLLRVRGLDTGDAYTLESLEPTPPLPPAPLAPDRLVVLQNAGTSLRIGWRDRSNDETSFVVHRAGGAGAPFEELATLPADTTRFTDEDVRLGRLYRYRVWAVGAAGQSSGSDVLTVTASDPRPHFHRGDASGDDRIGVTDAIVVLRHLFLREAAPACADAADANGDGVLDIGDPLAQLLHAFAGVFDIPDPGPPGRPCGPAPDPGIALGCEAYPPCE